MYQEVAVVFCFLQAFCEEGNIEDNGILAFAKFVIFSVLESRNQTGWFTNLDDTITL